MKNAFGILFSLVIWSGLVRADVIDPIGNDAYKTLVVNISQLDTKILADGDTSTKIAISFDSQEVIVKTSDVLPGGNVVKKITLPKDSPGKFRIYISVRGFSSTYSYPLQDMWGTVKDGVHTIEVRLKRIDIKSMLVTRPDGSTYLASSGKVRISQAKDEKWEKFSAFNMGLGIDVPVGSSYLVQVTADTEDGEDYFQSVLDFRKL